MRHLPLETPSIGRHWFWKRRDCARPSAKDGERESQNSLSPWPCGLS